MFGRFKNAIYSAVGGSEVNDVPIVAASSVPTLKYPYQRPAFLNFTGPDEIGATADHAARPIIVPRESLPWCSGYAEVINAGKSVQNEDQGTVHRGVIKCEGEDDAAGLPYTYFGVFDGHAGSGCAVAASNELHRVIHRRLESVAGHLIPGKDPLNEATLWFPNRDISADSLIIGALEAAFNETDTCIGEDKKRYKMTGGCTALAAVFVAGKLYVANAGDSRAVLCRDGTPYPMSYDFTPVSERQRLQQLGYQKPHLLGEEYTHLDFCRRPMKKDLGTNMLYRDAHMTGWTYKEINQRDLKFPVVYGEGKRSRLLATIGVTRGFGDHDLRAQSQEGYIYIKPFLSSQPEVRVFDVEKECGDLDVLVMATDGLWDVAANEKAARIVADGLKDNHDDDDSKLKYKYVSIAQDLVMAARGKFDDRNWWKSDGTSATIDDISVFVIPVSGYKKEYERWVRERADDTFHEAHLNNHDSNNHDSDEIE